VKRPSRSPKATAPLAAVDDQLCFSLYAATNAMTRAYAKLLAPLNLTYVQYLALLVLFERDDVPVKEIGRRLGLDSGTLTPLLKRLEASGYVERRRGERDEREVYVRLSKRARASEPALREVQYAFFCSTDLPMTRLKDLRRELDGLRTNLRSA